MDRKTERESTVVASRKQCDEIANDLVALFGQSFGGRRSGKFRISRKFLRQLAGRRHLSPGFLEEIAEEMYERGFTFIDLETYFAVIDQRLFNSYRRVTAAATEKVLGNSHR